MIRTISILVVLICGVLWLPLWAQTLLFVCSLFIAPLRFHSALVFPALVADALYTPHTGFGFGSLKVTIIVVMMLVVYRIVVTKTRFGDLYVRAK